MLDKIRVATVEELDGTFRHIELRQGANVIYLTLEDGLKRSGSRWSELKQAVDSLAETYHKKVLDKVLGGDNE